MEKVRSQVCLVVLDGWGYREDTKDNAIAAANIPFFRKLWAEYPHSVLNASGVEVGLPVGQMGNSEVGHMTIGAGRVIDTDLVRISKTVQNHELGNVPAIQTLFEHVTKHNSVLHIQGLVSPGGIHSHQEHLFEFIRAAKQAGITKIAVHVFTDGRDTAPQAAAAYVEELEKFLDDVGVGRIASLCGRYYAMDRDGNWDRVCKVEDAIFHCKGKICQIEKPSEIIKQFYAQNIGDEYIEPTVFVDDAGAGTPLGLHDGMFFFNFRADRARMISERIMMKKDELDLLFVTMTQYDDQLKCLVAFPPERPLTTLANEISKAGLTQAHIAETEKYAHSTYFLNGGDEEEHAGETFVLIPSRKDIKTHDQAPEMKAAEIANAAVEWILKCTNLVVINFANADMVGHTANVPATMKAVEAVDAALALVWGALEKRDGVMLVTADHGNAELNRDPETHGPHTAHTLNLVPAILTKKGAVLKSGGLHDIAPTILSLLAVPIPQEMTGKSLLV